MSMKRYTVQYTASRSAAKIFQELKERDCDNMNFNDLLGEIEKDKSAPHVPADSVFKDVIKAEMEKSKVTPEQRDRYRDVFIKPGEDSIQITILDHRISGEKCDELAKEVASRLGFAVTGRKPEEIKIVSSVAVSECDDCGKVIRGPGYLCPECGKTYCLEHMAPEKHGCAEKKVEKEMVIVTKDRCG